MRRDEENVKQRIFCLFAAAGRKNEKLREKKICVYMPIWRFRPMERTISDEKETCFGADSGAFHPACHGLRRPEGRTDHDCDEFLSDVCADAERDGRR